MRTVLLTAAAAFFLLGFAAHGTELGHAPVVPAAACIAGRFSLTRTYAPVPAVNCCDVNTHCSQYISTDALVRGPVRGRT